MNKAYKVLRDLSLKVKEKFVPIALILLSIVSILAQVVLNYVLSKNTTVETFGEYRNFLAIVSFSGIFHIGFVDGLYLKWLLKDEKPQFSEFISLFLIQLVCLTIVFAILHQTHLIVAILLQIFAQNLLVFSNSVLQSVQKFITSNVFIVANQILIALSMYAFVGVLDIYNIIKIYNGLYFVSISLLLVFLFGKKKIVFDDFRNLKFTNFKPIFLETLRMGFPVLLTGLVFVGFQNMDKIILKAYYSQYDYGLYAFGFTIINILIGIVLSVTNFILRKFIDTSLSVLQDIFTKLTFGLTLICILFLFCSPIFFFLINIYTPQYLGAKSIILALTVLILPYVLLQLLIFNLFKSLNRANIFFYNSVIHLVLLILVLFSACFLQIKLPFIPYLLLTVFLSWYLISEYFLTKINTLFKIGIKYRIVSVFCFVLINICYVVFS